MRWYQPTEFAVQLRAHMENWCSGPPKWTHWSDGIHAKFRTLAREVQVVDGVRLHDYAADIPGSQAFESNLFLPFREGHRARLSECLSTCVDTPLIVDEVRFEWVPPGALLEELDGEKPVGDEPAMAVDVVLWCRLEDGQRAVVLIEVKLSESGFTTCNGRTSSGNQCKDVCDSARLFFTDPNACYLRRPKEKRRDRRYWEIFAAAQGSVGDAFPGTELNESCPFAENAQQPMRNLAIACGLEQEGTVAPPGSYCARTMTIPKSADTGRPGRNSYRIPRWRRFCRRRRWWWTSRRGTEITHGRRGCASAIGFAPVGERNERTVLRTVIYIKFPP